MAAEIKKWREIATGTAEELRIVQASLGLQSGLWECAHEENNDQTVKVGELQERLAAKNDKYYSCQQNMLS